MLCEIRYPSFDKLTKDTEQNTIFFHAGLNIVCGGNKGDNSIGKTTFLNIVDFVFGSEHYPTEDVLENVGHHKIEFKFDFGNKFYFFYRLTQNPSIVAKCDQNYRKTSELRIEDFRSFLAAQYGLDQTGLSFRDALHCYVRIYNKKRTLLLDPIKTQGDRKSKSLERLLKLFGKYEEIAEALNKKNASEEKKNAYRNAVKYNVVETISKTRKKKNDEQIKLLKQELEKYESENQIGFYDAEATTNELVLYLKTELSKLKRQRHQIKVSLSLIDQNHDIISSKIKDKLADLHEFFPEVELRKIEEIENFHNGLKAILSPNIATAQKQFRQKLKELDTKIENLTQDLTNSIPKDNLSKFLFKQYARTVQKIEQLTIENNAYAKKISVESNYKNAKKEYTDIFNRLFQPIEQSINKKLKDANEYVCGKSVSFSTFSIGNPNKYDYINQKDEGTGSSERDLLLFQFVVLNLSPLPVLIEDSVNFKNIEDEITLKLLTLFNQTPKQIFIALDKCNHYSKDLTIPKIIQDNTVLKLSKGNELFGMAWNIEA